MEIDDIKHYIWKPGEPIKRVPITSPEAIDFLKTNDRTVAKDVVDDHLVSTVFLMTDHSYNGGPPVLFETMIFNRGDQPSDLDEWQDRYCTEEEARKGHAAAVAMVKESAKP